MGQRRFIWLTQKDRGRKLPLSYTYDTNTKHTSRNNHHHYTTMLRNFIYITFLYIALTQTIHAQTTEPALAGFTCFASGQGITTQNTTSNTRASCAIQACNIYSAIRGLATHPNDINTVCISPLLGGAVAFLQYQATQVCLNENGTYSTSPTGQCTIPEPPNACEDDETTVFAFGSSISQICSSGCIKRCTVLSGNAQCFFEPLKEECSGPDRPLQNCPSSDGFECNDDLNDPEIPPDADPIFPDEDNDFCLIFPQSSRCVDNLDQDPNTDSNEDGDPTNDPTTIDTSNNEQTTINNETESLGSPSIGINDSNNDPADSNTQDNGVDDQGNQCDPATGNCSGNAISGTCEQRPSCSGTPVQCAQLNQIWYGRCGGTHSDLGNCEESFECKSDPILCAQLRFDHLNYCATQLTEQQTNNVDNLANVAEGIDNGDNYNGINGEGEISLDNISTQFDTGGLGLTRQCVTDLTIDAGIASFTVPLSEWCSFLEIAGSIVILFGFLTGVRIVGDGI